MRSCYLLPAVLSFVLGSAIFAHGAGFILPPSYPDGVVGVAVASGDFNGDGKIDYAVSGEYTATGSDVVTVLLNNGDGTLSQGAIYATGFSPLQIRAADLNNDGRLDLITVNDDLSGSVTILLGKGDGTFTSAGNLGTGAEFSLSVDVGDVNGDGKQDLVVGSKLPNNGNINSVVSVLLGNGSGGFGSPILTNVPNGLDGGIVLGDFNKDGKLDAAFCDDGVMVAFGTGSGGFQTPVAYANAGFPLKIVSVDLNHDNIQDLVTANEDNTFSVMLGNSDGTFQNPVAYSGISVGGVTLADLNGDGNPDVLTNGGSNVQIFLGNGNGTFTASNIYAVSSFTATALRDVNGDGKLDIAGPNDTTTFTVVAGNGDGTFQAPLLIPATVDALVSGDVNKDGMQDVVAVATQAATVQVYRGNGNGTLKTPAAFPAGKSPDALAFADFNGDGILDLVVGNDSGGTVSVLMGNGNGTFKAPVKYGIGGGSLSVATGDLNGDHKPDIVSISNAGNSGQVAVLINNGDGTFQPFVKYNAGSNPQGVTVGDLNSDGFLDIAAADVSPGSDAVSVLLGNGDGTFGASTLYPLGSTVAKLAGIRMGDFNGDHKLDVVVGLGGGLNFFAGHGDGTLGSVVVTSGGALNIVTTDFNGDDKLDVIAADFDLVVYLGNGDGTFQVTDYGLGARWVAVADFNGDHLPEVVINVNSGLAVLLNTGASEKSQH